jgi:hypothetical protein
MRSSILSEEVASASASVSGDRNSNVGAHLEKHSSKS